MKIVDRFGTPLPDPPKHRRAVGFTGTTAPLREDEETINGIALPRAYEPDPKRADHGPPTMGPRK